MEKRRDVTPSKKILGTQCGGLRTSEFSPAYIKQRNSRKFRVPNLRHDMTYLSNELQFQTVQTWLIWEDSPTKRSFRPAVAIHAPGTGQRKTHNELTKQPRYLLNPPSTILEWQNITWSPLCGVECKKIPQ